MKINILILFLLLIPLLYFSNNVETKIVNTKNGVSVRSQPDRKSVKIGFISNRTLVQVIGYSKNIEKIEDKTGHWAKIKFKNSTGWIFDGFFQNKNELEINEDEFATFYGTNMSVFLNSKKLSNNTYENYFIFFVDFPREIYEKYEG